MKTCWFCSENPATEVSPRRGIPCCESCLDLIRRVTATAPTERRQMPPPHPNRKRDLPTQKRYVWEVPRKPTTEGWDGG